MTISTIDQMKTANQTTPKLRFPEFSGEWEITPLNKLAKRCSQKNSKSNIKRVLTNSAEYGVVDQRDYFDKDIANKGNLDGYFIVEKGDYIYNPRVSTTAPVGPISKNNIGTGVMSPLYTVFRFQNQNNEFFSHYFKTNLWHYYLRKVSSTGARHDRMAINNETFMAMPLAIPPDQEQQKIADCLSSLDNLITAENKKLDALKTHKKGLMQQLFPAEGETVPRLRFPEFSGDWEERKLGEVAQFASGGTPSKDIPAYWGGNIPWISASSMYETDLHSSELNITELAVSNGARIAKKGSLLILVRGSMLYNRVPMGIATRDVSFNQDVKSLTLGKEINVKFILYQLLAFEQKIPVDKTGIGAGKIDTDKLRDISIYLPPIPEQQKIADFLSSVDELISAQIQKIDALKTHKKGLMQQLFPVLSH